MGSFGDIVKKITKQVQSQPQAGSNTIQQDMSGTGGLDTLMAPTMPTTLESGVSNPMADSSMFGNRTNGLGVGSYKFGQNKNQGLGSLDMMNQSSANQGYNIMNGSNLI
jgi:hypothetical protein